MISLTGVAMMEAFAASTPQLLVWLVGLMAGWWFIAEAWRNWQRLLEFDAAGIRLHGPVSWDVPWSAVRELRLVKRVDKHLVIETEAGLRPSAPWGWFGTIFGAGRDTRVAYSGSKSVPKRPEELPAPGPRQVHTWWKLADPGRSVALTLLTLLMVAGVVFGWSHAMQIFAFFGAIAAGIATVFSLRPTRRSLIVDEGGIRTIGEGHWSLPWPAISSVQTIAGVLIIKGRSDDDEGVIEIEDSHRADDETEDDLVVRESTRQLRRRLLRDPDLRAAPIDLGERDAMQATIDHYRPGAWPLG